MTRQRSIATASPEILALWPEKSGNEVNGLDQETWRQPKPVFWRTDDSIAHLNVLRYFYNRYRHNSKITNTRKRYDEVRDLLRMNAKHTTNFAIANLALAGKVPEHIIPGHKLSKIFVARNNG